MSPENKKSPDSLKHLTPQQLLGEFTRKVSDIVLRKLHDQIPEPDSSSAKPAEDLGRGLQKDGYDGAE